MDAAAGIRRCAVYYFAGAVYRLPAVSRRYYRCAVRVCLSPLAWQFIYTLGLMCGWYKGELQSLAKTLPGKRVIGLMIAIFLVLFFVIQNNTNPFIPARFFCMCCLTTALTISTTCWRERMSWGCCGW
ncbi:OpgC domain-containing protein [Edwardsiella anguillarum]|nr:OpgC domain-containing protein [Edwardsiella anguillarum]